MGVDAAAAAALARLVRLELGGGGAGDEALKLIEDFGKIVGYMDILEQADVAGVEPLYSPMIEPLPPRADEPREPGEPSAAESLLAEAPERVGRFFAVPKIL
ncbi:MAG: aspartyl/glutamyl-tRNA amidotransferase subunit C [Deltaproteobacteria bacterium]|jgi:aspartyl-tRNA(Asn)/glutamyl-tRNA(Gln) amidotransferase subunit C|nr:aspartyl/glutamyl-tRNA amidotransferase subunit C [Deltaproteobacteria bacterium]